MKHRVITIIVCLAVAGLAGSCSSDDSKGSPPGAGATASTPAPAEPFDGDSPAEIWRKAALQAERATSVHVTMKGFLQEKSVDMDMRLARGFKAVGTIKLKGNSVKVRRIGKDLWFKADRGFWRDQAAGESAVDRLADRWVKARIGATTGDIFDLTNMSFVRKELITEPGTNVLYTDVVAGKKMGGHPTVALSAGARALDGSPYKITIYVTDDTSPLPMQFVALSRKKYHTQKYTYTDWNKKVNVIRPSNVLSLPAPR